MACKLQQLLSILILFIITRRTHLAFLQGACVYLVIYFGFTWLPQDNGHTLPGINQHIRPDAANQAS